MPVTLITFETERETESESSKFYEVHFDPNFFREWEVFIDRCVKVYLFIFIGVFLISLNILFLF